MRLEIINESGNRSTQSCEKPVVKIGRSSKSDIQIIGEGISRHHLTIECIEGKFFVTDHGSLNGVYVNDEKLPSNQPIEVVQFFPIRIGVKTTISILSDDVSRVLTPKSVFELKIKPQDEMKLDLKYSTKTKTKSIPQKNKSSNKKSQKNVFIIMGVILLIVFLMPKEENNQEKNAENQSSPNKDAAQTEVKTEVQLVKKNPYSGFNAYKQREIQNYLLQYTKGNCTSEFERKACEVFEFQSPLERVTISGKEIFLYTDYKIHRSSRYLLKFDTKTEDEILELWLSRIGLKTAFEIFIKFEKIVIINIQDQGMGNPPLVTHSSIIFNNVLGKIPEPLKKMDEFIEQSITINLDEKIRPFVTHSSYFGKIK